MFCKHIDVKLILGNKLEAKVKVISVWRYKKADEKH